MVSIAGAVMMVVAAATTAGATKPSAVATPNVVEVTRDFLDDYARGDREKILAEVDPQIVIYGSDAAEVFRGVEGARKMVADDQKLWRGGAKIGEMQDISVVGSGDLTAIIFQAPFTLGAQAPVLVRFSMLWKHAAGGWRLMQSANAVPTTGQSAEALLKTQP
jgi:ketosteroid isomerase-like protein